MKLMTPKGMADFPPEEKILRNKLISMLTRVFESCGFVPLETPAIERYETLAAKFAAGDASDAMKETFQLTDQGNRKLALRFDLTVPLSRFVAMNPALKMPFKRYQTDVVFRDGPIKAGRLRGFWQCDVDTIGTKSMLSDAECVTIAQTAFKKLDFDVTIEVNNRKLLNGILKSCELPENQWSEAIIEIDKIKKIGMQGVVKELTKKGMNNDAVTRLIEIIGTEGSNFEKLEQLKKIVDNREAADGIKELQELFTYIDDKNVELNLGLARGLAYYTGTVFEAFINTGEISSSLCGGGRYDKMIGDYLGGKKEYPAVGISFGIEPIMYVLSKREKEVKKTVTEVFVIPIQTIKESLEVCSELRSLGVNADMDLMGRNIGKNLSYANGMNIPYVIFLGGDEVAAKKVKLRDMKTGEESLLSVKEVAKKITK